MNDLLSITAVHPMREDAVRRLLANTSADWQIIHGLIAQDKLTEIKYRGQKFYMRKFPRSIYGEKMERRSKP